MALRTSELESKRDWVKFFNTDLKLELEVANGYADSLMKEGYCGKTIGHLLTHSTPGIPAQLLLDLGFKAGHCLKVAMAFVPPIFSTYTTYSANIKSENPKTNIGIKR